MGERCLIVGGGVIGLSCARLLLKEGFDVTVIEREKTGRESSWAAGGILSPLYPWRYPDEITALYRWSSERYLHLANELSEESGVDPEWIQSGMLILDSGEHELALEWALQNDFYAEILPIEDVVNGEPLVARMEEEALWFPEIAQIRPPRLMKALRKCVDRLGVHMLENTRVTGLNCERDRVMGVETQRGPVFADWVVIAGGAWSTELLESIGLKADIEPVRGQMILYKSKPGRLSRMVLYKQHYLIPRRDGRIVVGSTTENVGFEKKTTRDGLDSLKNAALEMMPSLQDCRIERSWAGLRPGKKDGIPWIGPHPSIEGLFIDTGHFRNGVILSPASAQLLVNWMIDELPIVDPNPYLPSLL